MNAAKIMKTHFKNSNTLHPIYYTKGELQNQLDCRHSTSGRERTLTAISAAHELARHCCPANNVRTGADMFGNQPSRVTPGRSEEHTSELQSRFDLVCRL